MKKTNAELEELGHILEKSLNEIYIFDSETFKFVYINESARKNLGYGEEELWDLTPWSLKPEYPPEAFKKHVEPLLSGKVSYIEFKTIHIRKDSSVYPVEVLLQLCQFQKRKCFAAIILDITDRKKLERDLIEASRLVTMGEMAAGIGHEINNPLAICLGMISRIKKELYEPKFIPDQVAHKVHKIELACERMAKIVSSLRTIASGSSGKSLYSLHNILNEVIDFIHENLALYGVQVTRDYQTTKDLIWCNTGEIHQVLLNLLTNARDALQEIPKDRLISITTYLENDNIIMKIADNGPGIHGSVKNKIFDTFYTTKKTSQGTGLGLSIASNILADHEAAISMEKADVGACFKLSFKVYESAKNQLKQKQPEDHENETGESKTFKILLVEDEEHFREILKEELEYHGHTVTTAYDGLNALEKVSKEDFEVVVTDLIMPRLSGIDYLEHMVKETANKEVQFIAMTGGVDIEYDKENSKKLHQIVKKLIIKPFDLQNLIKSINALEKKKD